MKPLQIPLEEGRFYHIFNRGNNGDKIFYSTENYRFFLHRLDEYLSNFIEIYAFCLLSNHFHLLVRVKEDQKALHLQDAKLLEEDAKLLKQSPVSAAFHRFFTSYSKAINKQEARHGSLFENPFKRKEVGNVYYLTRLVFYIHANPQLHGICPDFRDYSWSSYNRILSGKPTKLKKDAVVEWFNDPINYVAFHKQEIDLEEIKELVFE